jgi:poly(A) polymerase
MTKDAARIVRKLRGHGYQAYLVGGCVRDMLMGLKPKDYDVATDAEPDEVMRVFEKTIPVGAKFGVVIVRYRLKSYEVATFREESGYADGRRPDRVRFSTPKADAMRRDFTVNGLFYDPIKNRYIDYVGGRRDLEKGVIRAIGDPEQRFCEDKLRMLRAVRFASRFDFRIERKTAAAIKKHADEINEVSRERIRDELSQILMDERPSQGLRLMDEHGLLERVLPEVAAMKGVEQPPEFHPEGDVFEHTMIMLDMINKKLKKRPEFPFAVLLHDVGKPPTFEVADRIRFNNHPSVGAEMAAKVMKRLRFSRDSAELVSELVRDHLKFMTVKQMRASTLKRFLRNDNFDLHLELHRLDCRGSHYKLGNWRFCRKKLKEFEAERERLKPPRLLGGRDLIAIGLEPGPLFREILSGLEDAQLEGEVKTRKQALVWVRKHLSER